MPPSSTAHDLTERHRPNHECGGGVEFADESTEMPGVLAGQHRTDDRGDAIGPTQSLDGTVQRLVPGGGRRPDEQRGADSRHR